MNCKRSGFTLIEMLVVIAIIAVLVSIIIPVVGQSTDKAKAAVDGSNLRSVLGVLNTQMSVEASGPPALVSTLEPPESVCFPGARIHILFTYPGFIEVYYVSGANYYGLDYFSDIATDGTSDITDFSKPATPGDWYIAGVGPAA